MEPCSFGTLSLGVLEHVEPLAWLRDRITHAVEREAHEAFRLVVNAGQYEAEDE